MSVLIPCPSCGTQVEVTDLAAVTILKCPNCNTEGKVCDIVRPLVVALHKPTESWSKASAVPGSTDAFPARTLGASDQRPTNKKGWSARSIVTPRLLMICLVSLIGATFIGFGVVTVRRALEAAARTSTMCHLSQSAKAVHLAHDVYKKFPPYYGIYGPPEKITPFSFHTHLLPFVDQDELYRQKT